ncbi:MAG: hypothetical protein Q8R57_12480 [Bacteroidota bacterium]|nr:hypothetical protein [Bacteroidota bacterium]
MKLIFILNIFIFSFKCFGQTCLHKDISKQFNFETNLTRIKTKNLFDSCIVKITIIQKETNKPVQTIKIISDYFFEGVYTDCNSKRSYVTLKNLNIEPCDNDFGDIIVADFNFDNREDVALKKDSGGNGGPDYNYYLQDSTGKFIINKYLTNNMGYFPIYINGRSKTLTTLVHANAKEQCKSTYKLDTLTNKWKKISKTFVDY